MEKTLEICLSSIVNQTLKNLDITVVDDCSTDNSVSIINKFLSNYPNINLLQFNKNKELGYSRKYALSKTNTEYVTFVDADDWIDINTYKTCIDRLNSDKSDIAVYGIKNEYDNKKLSTIRYSYVDHCIDGHFAMNLLCNAYAQDIYMTPIVNNKIYRTAFLKSNDITFSHLSYYEDIEFSFKTIKCAQKISLIGNQFYHYYQNPNSKLHKINTKQINCFCKAFNNLYDTYIKYSSNDYEKKLFFSYLDKSLSSFILRIEQNTEYSQQKKQIYMLLSEMFKIIPLNEIINYVDVKRIIDFFRI